MMEQQQFNYSRIAAAIDYIRNNFKAQPSLEEIASSVHLSSFHFQRLLTEWAGTTPKKFLQYVSIGHARKLLNSRQATLADTAYEIGLSGSGRLHDLFVNIEGMTPAEYKLGGKNLTLHYSFAGSPFGKLLIASTRKGVCYMAFCDDEAAALHDLQKKFPNASYQSKRDMFQENALFIFQSDWRKLPEIKLHLKASDFQLKVWETLLKIPMGQLTTYGNIAEQIGNPNAFRAVGSAVGSNPVAYLIPCHRVIQSSGVIGGYMWGSTRKTAIIGWECAKTDHSELGAMKIEDRH